MKSPVLACFVYEEAHLLSTSPDVRPIETWEISGQIGKNTTLRRREVAVVARVNFGLPFYSDFPIPEKAFTATVVL
jgi:hypothetical protein